MSKVNRKIIGAKSPIVIEQEKLLYFAYGANMNLKSMKFRCPKAEPIGKLVLPNWKLVFRGVADIVPAKGEAVHGALWKITDDCEERLDKFEGFPRLYVKRYFQLRKRNGETEFGMFYVMRDKSRKEAPFESYYQTIRQGYQDFKHKTAPLIKAAKEVKPKPSLINYTDYTALVPDKDIWEDLIRENGWDIDPATLLD